MYALSFKDQQAILATMHQTLPTPPRNSTVFLVRHVAWAGLGVPVYAQWWDLFGAIRLTYHDRSLWGYPIVPPTSSMSCGVSSVKTTPGLYNTNAAAPYGRAFVLDMATKQMIALTNAATCRNVVAAVGVATPRTRLSPDIRVCAVPGASAICSEPKGPIRRRATARARRRARSSGCATRDRSPRARNQ